MKSYLIRRLLIMIPTFLGISLLLFVVLNLAPGRPGAQKQAEAAADLKGEATQESYRIFREQFGLDKPTLFNTRFALDFADIADRVRVAVGDVAGTSAERIAAQDDLEDFGAYAVPHLVKLIDEADGAGSPKLRDVAVAFLRIASRRKLVDPFHPAPSLELREQNRLIDAENARLRKLAYSGSAPETDKQRIIAEWRAWYHEHASRYEHSWSDKLAILFFDTRFATYWKNLAKLDFGVSLVSREPVFETLVGKLKYSLSLSLVSLLLAYAFAIPLGIFSAVKKDSAADRIVTLALFMLYSLPSFFVATVLLYFFSQGSDWEALRLFPTGGWQSADAGNLTLLGRLKDVIWHLVLPLYCLTYGSLAALSRYMRSGLLEVIQSDYVRTARAKGLPESAVIGKHALRNGLLPILTLLAGLLPAVLGGSVIIEYIFGIPGMGLWVVEAIYQRDYNVIMAVELLSSVLVLVGVLLTDLSYALVDPRIRYS